MTEHEDGPILIETEEAGLLIVQRMLEYAVYSGEDQFDVGPIDDMTDGTLRLGNAGWPLHVSVELRKEN